MASNFTFGLVAIFEVNVISVLLAQTIGLITKEHFVIKLFYGLILFSGESQ